MVKKTLGGITRYFKRTDLWLIFFALCCTGISLLLLTGINVLYGTSVGSIFSQYRDIIVQAAASFMGLVAAIVISRINYVNIAQLWKLMVVASLFFLGLTFIIGYTPASTDNKAWLIIPGINLMFQPAEIAKITFIFTFALHLEHVKPEINRFTNVLFLGLHALIPIVIVHLQGDDGTMLVFVAIFLAMLFAAGLSWKYFLSGAVLVGAAIPFVWTFFMSQYQKDRFISIINPDSDPYGVGWQQFLGKRALGSGELFGRGLFSGTHSQIPEMRNDFIFAFAGEALGFIGCLLILGVIAAMLIRILMIGQKSQNPLGFLICVGVFAMLTFQTVINVAMCLSIGPVIGITLPLISAGGTSVLTTYLSLGVVLSVYYNNNVDVFKEGY